MIISMLKGNLSVYIYGYIVLQVQKFHTKVNSMMHNDIRTRNPREKFRIFYIGGEATHIYDVSRVVHRRRGRTGRMMSAISVSGHWLYWNGRLNEMGDGRRVIHAHFSYM